MIGWKEIEKILYSKLSSTELLAQIDSNTLFFTTKQKKLFNEFYNFISEINNVEMIEKILKFVTGAIRLPICPKIHVNIF